VQARKTKRKFELLNREYDNFQRYLKTGEDRGVYSATKQQENFIGRLILKKNTLS